jgi:hypothetical protein
VPTEFSRRYDGFIFVSETNSLRPVLDLHLRKGLIPESWPLGQ